MLCPEGVIVSNETVINEEEFDENKKKKQCEVTNNSLELNAYKNIKTWKKSITNFFRQQLRSSKSIDVSKEITLFCKYIHTYVCNI
jgi:hypothetical protein